MDAYIEGEEDFSDQLKEYYGYCDSLRHLCRKQDLLRLDVEQTEDALETKKAERENFSQGKTGLLGKLALHCISFLFKLTLTIAHTDNARSAPPPSAACLLF